MYTEFHFSPSCPSKYIHPITIWAPRTHFYQLFYNFYSTLGPYYSDLWVDKLITRLELQYVHIPAKLKNSSSPLWAQTLPLMLTPVFGLSLRLVGPIIPCRMLYLFSKDWPCSWVLGSFLRFPWMLPSHLDNVCSALGTHTEVFSQPLRNVACLPGKHGLADFSIHPNPLLVGPTCSRYLITHDGEMALL